jgi:hypothetical protein
MIFSLGGCCQQWMPDCHFWFNWSVKIAHLTVTWLNRQTTIPTESSVKRPMWIMEVVPQRDLAIRGSRRETWLPENGRQCHERWILGNITTKSLYDCKEQKSFISNAQVRATEWWIDKVASKAGRLIDSSFYHFWLSEDIEVAKVCWHMKKAREFLEEVS